MSYGIVEIPEKGRGIVATKDLKEEEVLFTEIPICSAQMSWGVKLGYLGRFRYTSSRPMAWTVHMKMQPSLFTNGMIDIYTF